jgi:hypothetical protein
MAVAHTWLEVTCVGKARTLLQSTTPLAIIPTTGKVSGVSWSCTMLLNGGRDDEAVCGRPVFGAISPAVCCFGGKGLRQGLTM